MFENKNKKNTYVLIKGNVFIVSENLNNIFLTLPKMLQTILQSSFLSPPLSGRLLNSLPFPYWFLYVFFYW